jgi:hypothetical protein
MCFEQPLLKSLSACQSLLPTISLACVSAQVSGAAARVQRRCRLRGPASYLSGTKATGKRRDSDCAMAGEIARHEADN